MQRTLSLAAALLAGGTSVSIHASETIAPVIVTATRTAQTVDDSLAAVTVLDREAIAASQARSVTELLAGLPGVQVTSNGGYGKSSSVHLRGTNANHVLVLVDGMRIGSATMGSVSFEDLPLDSIERIEIVRGPRSSLYGADAIGGVIQIFTRGGQGAPRLRAAVGSGSHDTYRASAGLDGKQGNTRYALDVSRLTTQGFNSIDGNDPDRDGYRRTAASARIDHHYTPDHSLSVSALRSEGYNEYDGWLASQSYTSESVQQALNARWDIALSDIWYSRLSVGESRDESRNFSAGVAGDEFRTRRNQVSWQHDVQAGDSLLLTLGADHMVDKVETTATYSRTRRDNSALFAQGQLEQGRANWLLGLRRDDNDAYGTHTTGNLAWGYRLDDGTRLTASYGTAFKAPTFNDLYYQDAWGSNGNPDLKPEQSASSEIGVQNAFPGGQWQLRAYRTTIDNLIQWVQIAPWTWQPNNVGKARIDGLECGVSGMLGAWQLGVTLDLTDARDSATDARLPNRARESARIVLERQHGRLHSRLDWRAVGRRYADAANTQEVAGYGVLNAALHYDIEQDWRVEARVDNLLDQPYQEVSGYNTAGRTLFVGVSYRP
ncbi:TonB-dependent receptor domain-containing protein [Sulfurivermis fontis]|uniref:TonB-dependent receptor domain-containing protein n=1 Tax=Sulfurivermis fontis TaxID=1972068 RepID=UPI000FDB6A82|nr:TonB-dependent receptor [Sulfurivermis fontis]